MSAKPKHTPRKKARSGFAIANVDNGALLQDTETKILRPAFPLVAFLLPAKSSVSQWVTLPLIFMAVGLFRWATGFWSYSGFQKPPMHGDFEAQRHWMELTIHLPVSHWYFHELQWWGLDYPPLTAYHSWLLGIIGNFINPSWFAIFTSRGLDDPDLKVYMRATVIVSEYLTLVPALVVCTRYLARLTGVSQWESSIALVAALMQPGLMLIDHGHFQYNAVMLGFVAATMSAMLRGHPVRSCAYFVAALGFKQMALFYAPAVFAYLLGICIFPRINIGRLISIALSTLVSFAVLYAPFLAGVLFDAARQVPLPSDIQTPPLLASLPFTVSEKALYYPMIFQLAQSIHRIFPFSRGLFEDKVANIWCAIHSSGLHKLHRYDTSLLSRAALGLTLLSILPPCLIIFVKPRKELIPWAFAATAWGFFLCSYQVHEKNVLLPLLPMTVLLASDGGLKPAMRSWIGFANILATWTMYPLLKRDELRIPYFVIIILWSYLLGLPPLDWSISSYGKNVGRKNIGGLSRFIAALHTSFYLVMIEWHLAEHFWKPPARMPDLLVVLNACVGAFGFGLCYLWCLYNLYVRSGAKSEARTQAEKTKKAQ